MKAPEKGDRSHSLPLLVGPREIRLRRIVLTGFMGSGKTTVGPIVAERLGWRFVDVDNVIAAEVGATIPEIFKREGETEFRRRERETIARFVGGAQQSGGDGLMLAGEDGLVIALGGGAIEDAATRELLLTNPETLMVHLEVELATTLARCHGTEHLRPVLADEANLASRYERRLPLYRMAHVSLIVDRLTPDEVADAILRLAD
jgi:shikimate kinase